MVSLSERTHTSVEVFDHIYTILDHDVTGLSAKDTIEAGKVCRLWDAVVSELASIYFAKLNRTFDICPHTKLTRDEIITIYIAVKKLATDLDCSRIEELRTVDPILVRQALTGKCEAYFRSLIPHPYTKEAIYRELLPIKISQYFYGDLRRTQEDKSNEALSNFIFKHLKRNDPMKAEFSTIHLEKCVAKLPDTIQRIIKKIEPEIKKDPFIQNFLMKFENHINKLNDLGHLSNEDVNRLQATISKMMLFLALSIPFGFYDNVIMEKIGDILFDEDFENIERLIGHMRDIATDNSINLGYDEDFENIERLIGHIRDIATDNPINLGYAAADDVKLTSKCRQLINDFCQKEIKELQNLSFAHRNTHTRLLEEALFHIFRIEAGDEMLRCGDKFISPRIYGTTHPVIVKKLVDDDILSPRNEIRAYKTITAKSSRHIFPNAHYINPKVYLARWFDPATRNLTFLANAPLPYSNYKFIKLQAPHVKISKANENHARTIEMLKQRTALDEGSFEPPKAINELEQTLEKKRKIQAVMVNHRSPFSKFIRLGLTGVAPYSFWQRSRISGMPA